MFSAVFETQTVGCFTGFWYLNNVFVIETPKRHILVWNRVVRGKDREIRPLAFAIRDEKKKERKGKGRYTKSQVGYISAIRAADPFGPIFMKIGNVVGVCDVIIQPNFGFNIIGVSDLWGGSKFPFFYWLCWWLLQQCCCYRSACDDMAIRVQW